MTTLIFVLSASMLVQLPAREPIRSLGVQGRYVTINGRPTFLVGQMSAEFASGRSLEDIARILDVMMVPYGMNFCNNSDLGVIYWGAWNNRVNVEKGLEQAFRPHQYPWVRSGPGETTFGGPRFDLDRFDEAYFESLPPQIKLFNERGILPVVGIFSEHAIDAPLHWRGHPFHPENNINSLGLPAKKAIPEYFEDERALAYQEAYVRKLLDTLKDGYYILAPFGEMKVAPHAYTDRWLRLFEEYKRRNPGHFLVCLSGKSDILDRLAKDPAVDLIDIYCYHGVYDGREVNVPEGPRGMNQTIREAWSKYHKPVGKLYFKYGYPFADPNSPWAEAAPKGPESVARDAMRSIYENGGFGIFFKMAWSRDRGAYLKPDAWSEDIRDFVQAIESGQLKAAQGHPTTTPSK